MLNSGTPATSESNLIETGDKLHLRVEIGAQTRTAVAPVVEITQWTWKSIGLYHQLLGEEGEEGFHQEAGP